MSLVLWTTLHASECAQVNSYVDRALLWNENHHTLIYKFGLQLLPNHVRIDEVNVAGRWQKKDCKRYPHLSVEYTDACVFVSRHRMQLIYSWTEMHFFFRKACRFRIKLPFSKWTASSCWQNLPKHPKLGSMRDNSNTSKTPNVSMSITMEHSCRTHRIWSTFFSSILISLWIFLCPKFNFNSICSGVLTHLVLKIYESKNLLAINEAINELFVALLSMDISKWNLWVSIWLIGGFLS